MKSAPQPRKLQSWQAYHALTYESRWKPHVNQAWEDYKNTWESEHPNVKPEKGRFQIMVEFMKGKFEEETEEMKKKCEEYRNIEKREELGLVTVKTESAVNTEYQA